MLDAVWSGGKLFTKEHLIKNTGKGANVPPTILWAALQDREWTGKPHITDLLKGPRQKYLEITNDYSVTVDSVIKSLYGKAMHGIFDSSPNDDCWTEVEIDYLDVLMRFDAIYYHNNGELTLCDNKILGSYAIAKYLGLKKEYIPALDEYGNQQIYKTGQKKGQTVMTSRLTRDPDPADQYDFHLQLNAYRVAMNDILANRIGLYPQFKNIAGMEVSHLKLFIIPRDGNLREAVSRGIDEPFYYLDVPVMADELVREEITTRRDTLLHALETGEMPRLCTPREAWDGNKCVSYCPISNICKAHGDNTYLT